jgi:UDP-glucose 4-epimerase
VLRILGSIIVTGGGGFVGSHLTRRLLLSNRKESRRIVIIDSSDKISKGRISILNRIPFDDREIGFYREDIRNKVAISDILRNEEPIDIFIHLAARGNVHDLNVEQQEILEVNIDGTRNVLEACSAINVPRFLFSSSAAVYGEAKKLPLSENHPLLPLSTYGFAKMKAEALVSSFMLTGKIQSTISIRIFNIYGIGDRSSVISRFSKRLASGLAPIVYGDGNQIRDFISVDDVIDAILLASHSNKGGEFNVGTGNPVTIERLARKMIKIYGLHLEPIYNPVDVGNDTNGNREIRDSYADIRKSATLLKFTSRCNIDPELSKIREDSLKQTTYFSSSESK